LGLAVEGGALHRRILAGLSIFRIAHGFILSRAAGRCPADELL
jgi:hypothetical protein